MNFVFASLLASSLGFVCGFIAPVRCGTLPPSLTMVSSVVNPFRNFVASIVERDIAKGILLGHSIVTRFPPEPNGVLHLGHAKSIYLNHDLARFYGGKMLLRFDDTNPEKESQDFIDSIVKDVKWLLHDEIAQGSCSWDLSVRYTSNYFNLLFSAAEYLIDKGLAYVDDLNAGIVLPLVLKLFHNCMSFCYNFGNRGNERTSWNIDISWRRLTFSQQITS